MLFSGRFSPADNHFNLLIHVYCIVIMVVFSPLKKGLSLSFVINIHASVKATSQCNETSLRRKAVLTCTRHLCFEHKYLKYHFFSNDFFSQYL